MAERLQDRFAVVDLLLNTSFCKYLHNLVALVKSLHSEP